MFYVSLMVTTKQKPTVGIQKINRRKSNHTTMENNQFRSKDRRRGRKEQGKYKTKNNTKALVGFYLSTISLKFVNCLNSPIKMHGDSE